MPWGGLCPLHVRFYGKDNAAKRPFIPKEKLRNFSGAFYDDALKHYLIFLFPIVGAEEAD